MSKRLFWAPFWIFALILYGIAFLIIAPIDLLSQLGDETNEGYRD